MTAGRHVVRRMRPQFPRAIEAEYAAHLARRAAVAHKLVIDALRVPLATLHHDSRRCDNATDAQIKSLIDAIQRTYSKRFPPNGSVLSSTAKQIDMFATAQVKRQVPTVTVVRDASEQRLHDAWATANVDLIKTIDGRYFDDVRAVVSGGMRTGRATADITAELEARFGVSEARARVIARDQVGKLNGQTTRKRQTDAGFTHFMWSTSQDERVRHTHRELEGKVFAWDSPPAEGIPGEAIQCRCVAVPVQDPDAAAVDEGGVAVDGAAPDEDVGPSLFNPAPLEIADELFTVQPARDLGFAIPAAPVDEVAVAAALDEHAALSAIHNRVDVPVVSSTKPTGAFADDDMLGEIAPGTKYKASIGHTIELGSGLGTVERESWITATVSRDGKTAHVSMIHVPEKARGQGMAEKLQRQFAKDARDAGLIPVSGSGGYSDEGRRMIDSLVRKGLAKLRPDGRTYELFATPRKTS